MLDPTDHNILLHAVDIITQALDVGNSVCAARFSVNLRKTFDSLDHHVATATA